MDVNHFATKKSCKRDQSKQLYWFHVLNFRTFSRRRHRRVSRSPWRATRSRRSWSRRPPWEKRATLRPCPTPRPPTRRGPQHRGPRAQTGTNYQNIEACFKQCILYNTWQNTNWRCGDYWDSFNFPPCRHAKKTKKNPILSSLSLLTNIFT